jgi:hypothetical protein
MCSGTSSSKDGQSSPLQYATVGDGALTGRAIAGFGAPPGGGGVSAAVSAFGLGVAGFSATGFSGTGSGWAISCPHFTQRVVYDHQYVFVLSNGPL